MLSKGFLRYFSLRDEIILQYFFKPSEWSTMPTKLSDNVARYVKKSMEFKAMLSEIIVEKFDQKAENDAQLYEY